MTNSYRFFKIRSVNIFPAIRWKTKGSLIVYFATARCIVKISALEIRFIF